MSRVEVQQSFRKQLFICYTCVGRKTVNRGKGKVACPSIVNNGESAKDIAKQR